MGTCLSKKSTCAAAPVALPNPTENPKPKEEAAVKKEVFIIKHRNSHEVDRTAQKADGERGESIKKPEGFSENGGTGSSGDVSGVGNVHCGVFGGAGVPAAVRTSSCTKEEVDAILIQCGRLSRSSSTGKAATAAAASSESGGRKYSGWKRSYDFDHENGRDGSKGEEDAAAARERENRRRERHRQSPGRRRTPSRERDRDQASQPRSGSSRERSGASGGGRRVSRSPGRRSESPISNHSNTLTADTNPRPGKMVSVPATVAMDKTTTTGNVGNEPNSGSIKRIQVKRNVASPRARSPARIRTSNENPPQQPISLSRSNSRKAENSPYRRNPLAEIDNNIVPQVPVQKPDTKTNCTKPDITNCKNLEITSHNVAVNVIVSSSGQENPKPQTSGVAKTRSSRLSRELDINPDSLAAPNPPTSYTALLLEDIQNFHQKNNNNSNSNNPPPSFTLPACVTKAQSILEAVADLNSSTGSNLSTTCFDRNTRPVSTGKAKQSILESEIMANDDLIEPSFHKYVTVRRGQAGDQLEDQESSGSNSFAISGSQQQQQWVAASSCSWEPNSAESTDRWTTSEPTKRRENGDHLTNGIGRARGLTAPLASA